MPQEGCQERGHMTITACAAQPALGLPHALRGLWAPTAHGDPLDMALRRGTSPQIAVATGEDHHLSPGRGVTGEEQPHWTGHGKLQENFGENEGVGLKRSLEEAWRFATGRRDLGETAAASKLCLMSHFISEMVCLVWSVAEQEKF